MAEMLSPGSRGLRRVWGLTSRLRFRACLALDHATWNIVFLCRQNAASNEAPASLRPTSNQELGNPAFQ